MKTELQKIELIEKYLEGQLKGQQLKEFEAKLTNDAAFRQEVVIQNELYQSIEREGRRGLIAELNQIHQGFYGGTVSFFSRYKFLFISTVTGIIIISISFLFDKYSWNKNLQSSNDDTKVELFAENKGSEQKPEIKDTISAKFTLPRKENLSDKHKIKMEKNFTKPQRFSKVKKISDDYDKVSMVIDLPFDISGRKLTLKDILVNHPQYGFHYQIKDSNLYLYGDFLFEDIKVYYYQNDDKYHLTYNDKDFPLEETGKILPLITKKSSQGIAKRSHVEDNTKRYEGHPAIGVDTLPFNSLSRIEGQVRRETIRQPGNSIDNDYNMKARKKEKNKTGRTILQITDIDSLPNVLPDDHLQQDLYSWEIIGNDAVYKNHYLIKDNKLYLYGDFLERDIKINSIKLYFVKNIAKYYFVHNDKIYSLDYGEGIMPLVEEMDEEVLSLLEKKK